MCDGSFRWLEEEEFVENNLGYRDNCGGEDYASNFVRAILCEQLGRKCKNS